MKRLVIMIGIAACSGGHKPVAGGGSGGSAVYAKKVSLGWGFEAEGHSTNVFLQITDETGRQVSHPILTFDGECKAISPAAEMKAITGCACTGFELHAVIEGSDIVIMRARTDKGPPDAMNREEVTRIKAPDGAAIEAGT
jgi:hypothetical protein